MQIDERLGGAAEALRCLSDGTSKNIRVAMPGTIESFDSASQTASVRLGLRERISLDGAEEEMEIPVLPDVPVFFPGGCGYDLTYPVLPGMDCLVVFADCCIDAWWETGTVSSQTEQRRHDLSDGFALVGFRALPRTAQSYREDAIILRSAGASLAVTGKGVEITGTLTINGQAYASHTHGGVESGGGTTGGVT